MRICFILNNYPTKSDPIDVFVRPVVAELSKRGNECIVIAPQSIVSILMKKREKRDEFWKDYFRDGSYALIYQPKYISLSNLVMFGRSLSCIFQDFATKRVINKLKIDIDVFYGHFWTRGIAAGTIKTKKNIPIVVASGESRIDVYEKYSKKTIKRAIEKIGGIIFVSRKNKDESIDLRLLCKDVYNRIIPNGFNRDEFYPIDKIESRNYLRISENDIIAVFVGTFCHRKGVERVISASKNIPSLKLILIGEGDLTTDSEQIIFKGRIPHSELVTYLNASDFFVLPTLAEGCCNAIIEALACGLPVISSDLNFNEDIIDETCSIKINPLDVSELEEAMRKLTDDVQLRKKLSIGALKKSESLSIDKRVKKIEDFLVDVVNKY